MSDADTIQCMIVDWTDAIVRRDRAGILAHHADDLLMFDFPNTVRGIDAYARTWDFFDDSRRGAVIFTPRDIAVTAGERTAFASCEVHCDGTTAGPIDFRLTVGFEKRNGIWTFVHEHHSMPVTDETFIGPDVDESESR